MYVYLLFIIMFYMPCVQHVLFWNFLYPRVYIGTRFCIFSIFPHCSLILCKKVNLVNNNISSIVTYCILLYEQELGFSCFFLIQVVFNSHFCVQHLKKLLFLSINMILVMLTDHAAF